MEEDSSQAIDAPTTTSNVSGQFSFIKLLTDSDSECVSKPVQDDHSLEASDRLELAAEKSVAVEKLENNASKAYFLGIYSTEVNARISTRTVKISFVPRLIELMTSTETSRHCLRQELQAKPRKLSTSSSTQTMSISPPKKPQIKSPRHHKTRHHHHRQHQHKPALQLSHSTSPSPMFPVGSVEKRKNRNRSKSRAAKSRFQPNIFEEADETQSMGGGIGEDAGEFQDDWKRNPPVRRKSETQIDDSDCNSSSKGVIVGGKK
ncbi:unnamed protein product [Caenorhabditis angaria]|uniref:Uncharacterized protein n=1 Tax=Caenorhabditis angaria TaxID=860376 RepID=A0A9P1IA82_9PELO|nr:unnamed protein product [Caenorhabditis angaria]